MFDPITAPKPTLRRLVIFEAAVRLGSLGAAAEEVGLSQPAVTHAMAKLSTELGSQLLDRGVGGTSATATGRILHRRTERMLRRIEESLAALAPPGRAPARTRSLTDAQVRCHQAIAEAGSFRAASASLDIAEPTLHRAARSLEGLLNVPLYQRRPQGLVATDIGLQLATDFRLAWQEIEQALDELAAARGLADGRLSIGCLPLMPKAFLASAVGALLKAHPHVAISLEESAHAVLTRKLLDGDVDMVLGALRLARRPASTRQRRLFADPYVIVVGAHHPLATESAPSGDALGAYPWVIPWRDTPRRDAAEALFSRLPARPVVVMETSSLPMMTSILAESACITILCRSQLEEDRLGSRLTALPVDVETEYRSVGITHRADWLPTTVQREFIAILIRQARAAKTSSRVA